MIRRLGKFAEEAINGTALCRSVAGDDPFPLRPLNLDGPESRRRAMQAEFAGACGPQVRHPLCLTAATHEISNTVQVERAAERHRARLARLAARHSKHECPPESLHDRIDDAGHDEPRVDIASMLLFHHFAPARHRRRGSSRKTGAHYGVRESIRRRVDDDLAAAWDELHAVNDALRWARRANDIEERLLE